MSVSKTYQPAFFHLGECTTYQHAIDQSDWPIQTVIASTILAKAGTEALQNWGWGPEKQVCNLLWP